MQLPFPCILLSMLLPAAVYCAPTGILGASTPKTQPTAAAGGPIQIHKCVGNPGDAGYIVALKKGVKFEGSAAEKLIPPSVNVTQITFMNAFHAVVAEDVLTKLSALQAEVTMISENCSLNLAATVTKTQSNAPWGISRLTSGPSKITGSATSLNHQYTYEENAGSCADIYIVDTGVNIDHADFGGRAIHGLAIGSFGPTSDNEDNDGHGTHCAGIAAGTTYGVAKGAQIISVKVMEKLGTTTANVLGGLGWIAGNAQTRGRPSVVSYSIAGGVDPMLDFGAEFLVDSGIHFVAAAGNNNEDVATVSPAHLPGVITVGATDINDHFLSGTNHGQLINVLAPGGDIPSTWIGSTTATHVISGTSMAAPHVAGMVATLLCQDPKKTITPAEMQKMISTNALQNVVQGLPAGTPNRLAQFPPQAGQNAHSPVAAQSPPPPAQTGHSATHKGP